MKKISNKIIEDYETRRSLYESFTKKMEDLILDLIKESGTIVHSVTSRTKGKKSLYEKISKVEKDYKTLEEITDLSGIRIICLIEDETKIVSEIIENNFQIFSEFSVDINKTIEADRFGYLSIHYIVKLNKSRAELPEYQHYANLFCEIQIRSILQHAWAEIQHDLGYKSKIEIPKNLERKFYMLAGLLELADGEFCRLKDDVEKYAEEVEKKIKKGDEGSMLIDKTTLESYLNSSTIVKEINLAIVKAFGDKELVNAKIGEIYLKVLVFLKIDSIKELDKQLNDNKKEIIKFAERWLNRDERIKINKGEKSGFLGAQIAIFYLGYVFVSRTNDRNYIKEYIDFFCVSSPEKVVDQVLRIYESLKESVGSSGVRTEFQQF